MDNLDYYTMEDATLCALEYENAEYLEHLEAEYAAEQPEQGPSDGDLPEGF